MKLTTTPTAEDMTSLAQDIIAEILSGLIKGIKISVDHGIYVYAKRPGEEAISQIYYNRESFFELEDTHPPKILQLSQSDGSVIAKALIESRGKFSRYQ